MTDCVLSRRAARRLIHALLVAELTRLRGPGGRHKIASADTDPAPLELDSLERMGALAAIGEAFDLDQNAFSATPTETLDGWVDCVRTAKPDRFVAMTSGSTGAPKACAHTLTDLFDEAAWFAQTLPTCRRVIAMVPANHLYGVIWTVLLPDAMDVPVVDASVGAMPDLSAGDLIVAVPDQWAALARLYTPWPAGLRGVSSAGRLSDHTADQLIASGLSDLFDVYGASETGAIGLRAHPEAGYALLPRWRLENGAFPSLVDRYGAKATLPDQVEDLGCGRIRPTRRLDRAVQVGGQNVHLDHVADRLREVDDVSDVAVRSGDDGRLKAFVVPKDAVATSQLEARLRDHAKATLRTAEQPTTFRFGEALPRNTMGKAADWP